MLVLTLAAPPPVGELAAMVSEVWMQERQKDVAILKARTEVVSEFLGDTSLSVEVTADYPEQTWADETVGPACPLR